jgi:hypothetical protein
MSGTNAYLKWTDGELIINGIKGKNLKPLSSEELSKIKPKFRGKNNGKNNAKNNVTRKTNP